MADDGIEQGKAPPCADRCEPGPWEPNPGLRRWPTEYTQPSRGWHRFIGGQLPPSEITMRAISIVGCPCRLEQMLRLPGLSATSQSQLMHAAAERWRDDVTAELEQIAKVEEHLRAALEAAGLRIGLDYGLRITHATKPRFEGSHAITDPLDTPIEIDLRDVLKVFAERLKEDAARLRGNLEEMGLYMSRLGERGQHVRFTAFSPQDRFIGKEDDVSRSLLTDAKTSASRAHPSGVFRSAYAKIDRHQVAALAALGWDRGELADLITASRHDWGHPPTDIAPQYRYERNELTSDDPGVRGAAKKRRQSLMKWLENHEPPNNYPSGDGAQLRS